MKNTERNEYRIKERRHLLRIRFRAVLFMLIMMVCVALLSACITISPGGGSPDTQTNSTDNGTPAVTQEDPAKGSTGSVKDESGSSQADSPALSEEDAIAIVLERVPGATEDEIISFSRDYDDGRWEYEGSLLHDGVEYEFEIDAQNGNILDWEIDD